MKENSHTGSSLYGIVSSDILTYRPNRLSPIQPYEIVSIDLDLYSLRTRDSRVRALRIRVLGGLRDLSPL